MEETLNDADKQENNRKCETCYSKDTKKRKTTLSGVKHRDHRVNTIGNPRADLVKNVKDLSKDVSTSGGFSKNGFYNITSYLHYYSLLIISKLFKRFEIDLIITGGESGKIKARQSE